MQGQGKRDKVKGTSYFIESRIFWRISDVFRESSGADWSVNSINASIVSHCKQLTVNGLRSYRALVCKALRFYRRHNIRCEATSAQSLTLLSKVL